MSKEVREQHSIKPEDIQPGNMKVSPDTFTLESGLTPPPLSLLLLLPYSTSSCHTPPSLARCGLTPSTGRASLAISEQRGGESERVSLRVSKRRSETFIETCSKSLVRLGQRDGESLVRLGQRDSESLVRLGETKRQCLQFCWPIAVCGLSVLLQS